LTTLDELFPGALGRLRLTRVAMLLKDRSLLDEDPKKALPGDKVRKIKSALEELQAA